MLIPSFTSSAGLSIGQIHLEEEGQGDHSISHRFHPSWAQNRDEKGGVGLEGWTKDI